MIRDATPEDATAVAAIYAYHVLNGVASYETDPPGTEEIRARIVRVIEAGWPWLVADVDGTVVGYAYATQMRDRPAYLTDRYSERVAKGRAAPGAEHLATLQQAAE